MKRLLFCLVFLASFTVTVFAKVKLPEIVGDNMVLQQNTKVKIWGEAAPNQKVSIRTTWDATIYSGKSDAKGTWLIQISTPKAGYKKQQITISDGEITTLKNILIGEVWFCSGQSNMQMPLNGFWNCPIEGANETIATSGQYKNIRMATIPNISKLEPQSSCPGQWKESNPENAAQFGATAYHFAMMLNKSLDVPVGIINCSWGGSTVEGWLKKEILQTYPDVDLSLAGSDKIHPMLQPMIMYNGMLKPLVNYTIKGFLWYQGESNVGRHQTYADRLATMVKLWREEWGQGELPFYFVEIAPFEYGEGDAAAFLREAQYKAQKLIPNSGMISTNDLVADYERKNIHPKNKKQVGERLCYMALANTYGFKNSIWSNGPEYKSLEIKDGKAFVSFDFAQEGFSRENGINGFEIAGADKVFYPATAVADLGNRIIVVSSEMVKEPMAVRYCFRNFLIGNLYNHRELPVVPFRSDNW